MSSSILRMARRVLRTGAEGPGMRYALWLQGCTLGCPGCCNPEMIPADGGEKRSAEELAGEILAVPEIEGITVLGGEPLLQALALTELLREVRRGGLSVMLFTGFTLKELRASEDPALTKILMQIDLLVDGRYERENPEPHRPWIGSANQNLHFLTSRYDPGHPSFRGGNRVEVRIRGGEVEAVGWPDAIRKLLKEP